MSSAAAMREASSGERGSDARQKILAAARDLFAERGVEGMSLREITRTANQGNTRALQYHFGDRDALLRAVLEPHQAQVDSRRDALLDEIEAENRSGVRDIASALVRPSAAMLEVEGGKAYLQIMAELWRNPGAVERKWPGISNGLGRWRKAAMKIAPESSSPFHRRFAAMQLCFSELARRASTGRRRRSGHQLFVSDLIDLVGSVLDAPVSEQTQRLLDERDRSTKRSR